MRLDVEESPTSSRELPAQVVLHPNYPNPFNPSTTFRFALPNAQRVTVRVYDVLGREVALLADGLTPAGVHEVTFDAGPMPGHTVRAGGVQDRFKNPDTTTRSLPS